MLQFRNVKPHMTTLLKNDIDATKNGTVKKNVPGSDTALSVDIDSWNEVVVVGAMLAEESLLV